MSLRSGLMVLALTAMWAALWGDASVGTLIAGLLAGVGIVVAFPAERSDRHLVIRPIATVQFAAVFIWNLVTSTVHVARVVLSPQAHEVRGLIIPIKLSEEAYPVRTVIAHSISLTPGTLTVDVGQEGRTLYVHVMERTGEHSARAAISALERRATAAFAAGRVEVEE